jgi:hypothetical protein
MSTYVGPPFIVTAPIDRGPAFWVAVPTDWGSQPIVQFVPGLQVIQGTIVLSSWSGVTGIIGTYTSEYIETDDGYIYPEVTTRDYVSDLPGAGFHIALSNQTLGASEPEINVSDDRLHYSRGPSE